MFSEEVESHAELNPDEKIDLLKVGMLLDKEFPPDPRVENEAKTLTDSGYDVYLWCLDFCGRKKFEEYRGIKIFRHSISRKAQHQLLGLAMTVPFYHFIFRNSIRRFLSENQIRIVHVHDLPLARTLLRLNSHSAYHLVLDLHENRPEIMKMYSIARRFPQKIVINLPGWKKYEEEAVQQVDDVIVVTDEAKKELCTRTRINLSKITVVPNSICLNEYSSSPIRTDIVSRYSQNFTLCYIGDTSLRRGIDVVLRAIPSLREEISELKFVVVGSSSEDKLLHRMVNRLGIHNTVDFVGWQHQDSLLSYIKAADVCISPLKRNLHHDTTLPNKLFQYMAGQKPMIVSNCPAQKNLVERSGCGLSFESENSADLKDKLLRLYHDPSLREKMGRKGYDSLEQHYQWSVVSQTLVELYSRIADNTKDHPS